MNTEFIKKHASRIKAIWEWLAVIGGLVALVWLLLPLEVTKCIIIFLSLFGLSVESGPWELSVKVFLLLNGSVGIYLRAIRVHFEEALQDMSRTNKNENVKALLASYGIVRPTANITFDDTACHVINNLLTLVTKYMHHYAVNLDVKSRDYGVGVRSEYYIYTLAASHEEEDLDIMAWYLTRVVYKIIKKNNWNCANGKVFHLPVLIALQNRNVILAEQVSNKTELPILTYQPARKKANGNVCDEDKYTPRNDPSGVYEYEFFYRTYLGCDKLKQKIVHVANMSSCTSVWLHFILIDCNVTRGSSFVEVIDDPARNINFNNYVASPNFVNAFCSNSISGINVKFCGINEAATLFVAATEALKKPMDSLPSQLDKARLRLWYYFVLSEDIKKKLYEMKTHRPTMCYSSCNFGDILKDWIEEDTVKQITGFSANGWFNAQAKTPEELIACLPRS